MSTTEAYSRWIQDNPEIMDRVRKRFGVDSAPVQEAAATPEPAPAPDPMPAPAPQPAAAPQPEPIAPVMTQALDARNPYKAQSALQHEQAQSFNRDANSLVREGAARSASANEQAATMNDFVGSAKQRQAAADANHDENRAAVAALRKQHDELLKKLSEPVQSKGGSLGLFAGIAAAVAGAGGNTGIAQGMQMLQNHVQSNIERKMADRAESAKMLGHLENAIGERNKDSADEVDYAHGALANEWFTASRQLDAQAKKLEGTTLGEQYGRMANEAARNGNAYVEKITQGKIAKAEAAKAAGAGKNLDEWLSRQSDQKLMMLGTKEAIAKLKERQAVRKGEVDIQGGIAGNEKTAAETAKLAAGANGMPAPVGWDVENPALYSSLSDTERAKFREGDAAASSLKQTLGEMRSILAQHGTESTGKNAERLKTLLGLATVQFKNSQQLGALDVGTQELAKDIFGNPNALFTGGPTTIAKMDDVIRSTDNDLNNRAKVVGLRSKAAADVLARDFAPNAPAQQPAQAGPPAPPPQPVSQAQAPAAPTITMISPDGRQVSIPADKTAVIDAARARGMVTLEEYQDAQKQQQFEAEQQSNQLAYNEGR